MLLILLNLTLRQIQQEIEMMIQPMHLMTTLLHLFVSTKSISIISIIIPSIWHTYLHPLIQLIIQLFIILILAWEILLIINLQKCSCFKTSKCSQNHASCLLLLLKLFSIFYYLLLIRWMSFYAFLQARLVCYVMITTTSI